jgi:hypothetical protein
VRPHVRVHVSDGFYRCDVGDWDRLVSAWHSGLPTLHTTDYYGARLAIRSDRVEAIALYTSDVIAAVETEAEDERVAQMLEGAE